MAKLFVGGFPLDMTEMELVQLVGPHGTVNTIKIVRDKKSGKCKGYAFLEMTDRAGADNAIEALDGTSIGDRVLSLSIAPDVAPPKFAPSRYPSKPKPGFNKWEKPAAAADAGRPKRPRKQF